MVQPDTSCTTPQSLADLPLTLANESTDTTVFATDTSDFEQLPLLFDEFNILEWRREIKERGKYWQWRKGSGDYRPSRYGGTFDQLDDERKAQYAVNKHIYGRNRAAHAQAQEKESDTNEPNQSTVQTSDTSRSAGDAAQRHSVLPDQRRTIEVQPESSRITPTA